MNEGTREALRPSAAAAMAVERSVMLLDNYVERVGLESYDPHDLMSTPLGRSARRGFYGTRRGLFTPIVGVIYGLDLFLPSIRRLVCEPTLSPEALTYLARAKLDLWAARGDSHQLDEAVRLLRMLKETSVEGYSGPCWGLPFDWQTTDELVPRDTPCVTITAAVALLMLDAASLTGMDEFSEMGRSSAQFVLRDLNKSGPCVSYTPVDRRLVVNANAYAADLLLEVGSELKDKTMVSAGRDILARVLREQRDDGAWPYFFAREGRDGVDFVDCLHTCFVLECLMRIDQRVPECWTRGAIERGLDLLVEGFIGQDGSCRHYLSYHSPHLVRADARSCAEAARCLCFADRIAPGSRELATRVALWAIHHMQMGNGSFRHRLAPFPTPAASYNRWSNGPMLAALALLNRVAIEHESDEQEAIDRIHAVEVCDGSC